MMLCSHCRKKEASVFFKAIDQNQVIELHLCGDCAEKRGISLVSEPSSLSIPEILAGLSGLGVKPGGLKEQSAACQACGLRYSQFRETGRLGCNHCYASFRPLLAPLVSRIHGFPRHQGRTYRLNSARNLEELKKKLKLAVATEDFETAVALRDQIRQAGQSE
ncbi:MAG: UvrB/UvrC motif-containing protein [Elusimicrobia bacterium]|nr:UvrB/UvrC motif-containing protein [Elusimicrobiota bacterium]